MIIKKYFDFLFLNESKVDKLKKGDFVICDTNFAGIKNVVGKLAKIDNIGEFYLKLKIQKPIGDLEDSKWMAIQSINVREIEINEYEIGGANKLIDTLVISKKQGAYLTLITPEEAKEYLKGNLTKFEKSDNMGEILNKIKLEIKKKYTDVSYVDIDKEKNDSVTFIPANKIIKLQGGSPYTSSLQTPMKVGKFFRKLNPDLTDKEVDTLITLFKVEWDKLMKGDNDEVEVVTGEDIRYWYLGSRYGRSEENGRSGDLGGSCMQYTYSQHRFDIYVENPDKVAMAIIVKNKKLMARAIIWKLDDGGVYMDRIYAVDKTTEQKMRDFCAKKNMEGPWIRGHNGTKRVTLIDKDFDGPTHNPFMDSMKYFNIKKHQLLTTDAFNKDWKNGDYFDYYLYTDND